MSTFTFKGFDSEGHKVVGSKSFATQESLQKYLDGNQIMNYEIFESKTNYKIGVYSLVSAKELSVFCRQMSVLFFSHITLMEGTLLLAEQTENKQMRLALLEIHERMSTGYTFAESMAMYGHIFTTYLTNMITIGETSGTLDNVFARMSDYYDKESRIRKKLKSAVTYPAILTTLMVAIVFLLIVKILPMFNDILSTMGGEMPALTNMLLAVSGFFSQYFLVLLVLVAMICFIFIFYIHTEKGMLWYDKMKVKAPLFRYIHTRVITSRFSRSLAILLKSGVQLLNAMEDIIPLLENKYLQDKFTKTIQDVKQGKELSEALKEMEIFPPLFLKMIVIGQSTGHLDDMLDKSANIFDEEVDDSIERVTIMIEPILIIILSIIVGFILLSVMLPMISIMNAIG